jgi:hypothetical protein
VRLKSVPREVARKWKLQQKENGYCPHYHKIGRILMEVRFPNGQPRDTWIVVNLVTKEFLKFRRNGAPLKGSRGRLVGPLIEKRRVRRCP